MTYFITSYLSTVTSDPEATFAMLTPEFQEASNGFEGYSGFWGTVESATPSGITADPESLTVTYTVDYVMKDGRREHRRRVPAARAPGRQLPDRRGGLTPATVPS